MTKCHTQNRTEPGIEFVGKILCPQIVTGRFIGDKGRNVQAVSNRTGADIYVSKRGEFFPSGDERVVSIKSTNLHIVKDIIHMVQNLIITEDDSVPRQRKSLCLLVLSHDEIGKVVGIKGAMINKLSYDFGVQITSMKRDQMIPELPERWLRIAGKKDIDVHNCADAIIDIACTTHQGMVCSPMQHKVNYMEYQQKNVQHQQSVQQESVPRKKWLANSTDNLALVSLGVFIGEVYRIWKSSY